MTVSPSPSSPPITDPADPPDHRRCARCDYPLRGLPIGRACPECGSNEVVDYSKRGLKYLPRPWRRRAMWAMGLMTLWAAVRLGWLAAWWSGLAVDAQGYYIAGHEIPRELYNFIVWTYYAMVVGDAATCTMLLLIGCPRLSDRPAWDGAGRLSTIFLACLTIGFSLALVVPSVHEFAIVGMWNGRSLIGLVFDGAVGVTLIIDLFVLCVLAKRHMPLWAWHATATSWLLCVVSTLLGFLWPLDVWTLWHDTSSGEIDFLSVFGPLLAGLLWFRALSKSLRTDE